MLVSYVEDFLDEFNLLDSTFIVGFSGGADSLCLLDIMVKLARKYKFQVIAAHLNHNWRGQESIGEQMRCAEIAQKYGIDFITNTLDEDECRSEDEARKARYCFFEKYAKIFGAVVLTAHNANDNAETIIYRVSKGTGIKGLMGIPEGIEKGEVSYFRPLLKILRSEIENYCAENVPFQPNYDSSNDSVLYKRNFIRREILPLMQEINPNVIGSINSLSEIAIENEQILEALISEYFIENDILIKKFVHAIYPLKCKILHKFLALIGLPYDRKKVLNILNFIENKENFKKRFSLTNDLWLTFNEEKIYCVREVYKNFLELKLNSEGIYETPFGGTIEILPYNSEVKDYPNSNELYAYVDFSNINFPLTLRTRRDGDIFQPFGMKTSIKLKKYLITKKISREKRDTLLLLTKGNEVLWIVGVALSEKLRVAKYPVNVLKYNYR